MTLKLFDLAAAEEDRRFSPYCWRIRMAMLHKGLDFETIPWRFTDKDAIAFAGSDKVPVLVDADLAVHDSPVIAAYLEDHYPDRPSLFGGPMGRALCRFIEAWCDTVATPGLFRLIGSDIAAHLAPKDQDYFRRTREARLGTSIEAYCANRPQHLAEFRTSLTPLRRCLSQQDFLCGGAAAWADYVLFGAFQWARCISPVKLLEEDDPVGLWRARMLALFDGAAARAKGYPV